MPLRQDESFPRYNSLPPVYVTFFVPLLLKSSEISKSGAGCRAIKRGAAVLLLLPLPTADFLRRGSGGLQRLVARHVSG